MPLFEYRCAGGHLTEELLPVPAASVACGACGAAAPLAVSLPSRGHVRGGTDGGKDAAPPPRVDAVTTVEERDGFRVVSVGQRGFRVQEYHCPACGKRDLATWRGGEPEPGAPACCGRGMDRVVGAADIDWFTRATQGSVNGLYDRAAGRWFASKAERKAWMDANGLEDGGDVDFDAVARRRAERERREDDAVREAMDAYDRDPALLRLRDQGRVRDWAPWRPAPR